MISTANLVRLPAFIASSCDVNAIVDTPQGSQNKFKFDEQTVRAGRRYARGLGVSV